MPFVRTSRKSNDCLPSPMAASAPPPEGRGAATEWKDMAASLDGASAAAPDGAARPPEPRKPPSEPGPSQQPAGGPPRRQHAYDPNGPVEAVGLQEDQQFWDTFRDVRTLGRGHFAKVKEVQHVETDEHFAVKILDKTLADHDIDDLARAARGPAPLAPAAVRIRVLLPRARPTTQVREFQMLRSLRHPNIIRLYGAYETPRKLYLVTELASGGELMKRLGDSSKVYSEVRRARARPPARPARP